MHKFKHGTSNSSRQKEIGEQEEKVTSWKLFACACFNMSSVYLFVCICHGQCEMLKDKVLHFKQFPINNIISSFIRSLHVMPLQLLILVHELRTIYMYNTKTVLIQTSCSKLMENCYSINLNRFIWITLLRMPLQWYNCVDNVTATTTSTTSTSNSHNNNNNDRECRDVEEDEEQEWRKLPKNSAFVFASYGITYCSRLLPL